MKTKIIFALLLLFPSLQAQSSKIKNEPLSDLKWGKFENHPVRDIIKEAHWLEGREKILYASTLSNFFDIEELVHSYSDLYPDLLLPYKKDNEFEKRRLLPEIKTKWEKMGKELLKYETLLITTQKTTFGEYDFNNKGFSIRQPINFYDGILLSTSVILHPKTDDVLFPNFINVEENLAEQIISSDKKRELEQILIVKPIRGSKLPYHGAIFRQPGYGLECIAVYNIIVTKESKRVLRVIENQSVLPVILKSNEITASVEFEVGWAGEFIEFLFYPFDHQPFIIENAEHNETVIEADNSAIKYGSMKGGTYKFYLKGGDKEQTIYIHGQYKYSKNPNTVEENKLLKIVLAGAINTNLESQDNLTEEEAKKTADELLAQDSKLHDNGPPPAKLIEWKGLVKISDTEMYGEAAILHLNKRIHMPTRLDGKFIFNKDSLGKWCIKKVDFIDGLGYHSWIVEVYQEVK